MRVAKVMGAVLATVSTAGLALFFAFAPGVVESQRNKVTQTLIPVSVEAREIHRSLFVADLHADSTLWDRDLLTRSARGQVDVPRLIDGGVALQAFTIVTKTPRSMNIVRNTGDTDNITLLAIAQLWPPKTWGDLTERALHQADRVKRAAERSSGKLRVIRSGADLDAFDKERAADRGRVAALIGVEGAHALGGHLANLDRLHEAGIRMMSPSHFFDTEIGGSAHGVHRGGLTPLGREWLRQMEARKMIVDVAHASTDTVSDILSLATRPVVVSHTGVRGTCDNQRNLSDAQLVSIARNGGIVGIGFWDTAVCGGDARAIARAIRHVIRVAGGDHAALGSDFDGAVTTPFDASRMVQVTQALLDEGLDRSQIEKVVGGNTRRVLARLLN